MSFKFFKRFLGFNYKMPDTKLRPTSTMKTFKLSEQRFGHVNATNLNSYSEYHFYYIIVTRFYYK